MAAIGPIYVVSNRTSKKRADLAKALRSTGWKQVKAPPEVDHPDLDSHATELGEVNEPAGADDDEPPPAP